MTDSGDTPAPLIPAATVVILRDGSTGPEALMVQRSRAVSFAGGMWVFPGGRVDPDDVDPDRPGDEVAAARRAAVREAHEETGLVLRPDRLVCFSHWTPPPVSMKRYGTWFFAAEVDPPTPEVVVDGGEILDHRWARPVDVLAARNRGELDLAPPTWITLEGLIRHRRVADALAALAAQPPEHFATRFAPVDGGVVALYHGDSGYDDEVVDRPGPRHRLWMLESGWRYDRTSGG